MNTVRVKAGVVVEEGGEESEPGADVLHKLLDYPRDSGLSGRKPHWSRSGGGWSKVEFNPGQ
jgi:hypothetical protein